MRTLSEKDSIAISDFVLKRYGWLDRWLLKKMFDYVSKYGKDGNPIDEDIETAYIILEEKSFHKEDFENE
jgi:hypothetical protein